MEEPEPHPPKSSTRMNVPYGESTNSDNPMTEPIYRSCSQCGRIKRSASTLNMENHCQQCDVLTVETQNAQSFPSMRPLDIDSPWLNSDTCPNPVRNATHRQSSTLHGYSLNALPKFSDKRSQMYQTRLSEENKLNRYYSLRTPIRTQMRQIRTSRHAPPHPDPLLPRNSGRSYGAFDSTVISSSRYFGRHPNNTGLRPWNLDFLTQSGYYGRRTGGPFYEGLDQPGMARHVSNDDESLAHSDRNVESRTRGFPAGEPYTEHHCSSSKYDITDWACEKRRRNRTCDSKMFLNDRASRRHESCCNSRLYEDCDILESDAESSEDFDIRRTCSHRMFSPSIPDEEEFTHEQCYHSRFCECNREQGNLSYPKFMCEQQRPYLHERTPKRFASIIR